MLLDRRLLPPEPVVDEVETLSELRRVGVIYEDVERDSEGFICGSNMEAMRLGDCRTADAGSKLVGEETKVDWSSPSVHCKCRMTDFVAHYGRRYIVSHVGHGRHVILLRALTVIWVP